MQIKKLCSIGYLLSLLLVLPGWRSFHLDSEMHQPSVPVGVRSAIVLDENGSPVCHADLQEHPQLVPDFARLNLNSTVDPVNSLREKLASSRKESNLPPCTGEYLNQLEEVAINGVVVSHDKSHIHKASLQKDGAIGIAACLLGGGAGYYVGQNKNIDLETKGISTVASIIPLSISTLGMPHLYDKIREFTEQLDKAMSSNQKQEIQKKISRYNKGYLTSVATSAGSACYVVGNVIGMLVYISN